MDEIVEIEALLLSRGWRDTPDGVEITLWGASASHGPVEVCLRGQESVFFVPRESPCSDGRRVRAALQSREGHDVDAVYFRSQRALEDARDGLRTRLEAVFESDVKPSERFLMERFVTGAFGVRGKATRQDGVWRFVDPGVRAADVTPTLRVLSLDVETEGWDGPLLSVALAAEGFERVFMVPAAGLEERAVWPLRSAPPDVPELPITWCADERTLLEELFAAVRDHDPDVLVGWNVVDFDLRVLVARSAACRVPCALGRRGARARVLEGATAQQVAVARVPGRVVLDGVATMRSATYTFERFSLEHVAQRVLGRGKKMAPGADPLEAIRRMHREEPAALAAYNLEDARLVRAIFDATGLLDFAVERARLTGLALDRQGGSVAAFDHLYLPRLHRRGLVAPDVGVDAEPVASPGGHVLEGKPGLHRHVLAFDFRSLYPSLIRTFQIDPLALWRPGDSPVPGFDGAHFAREGAILPGLVAQLHDARGQAKARGQEALSRAIKIAMNSFYGVLGTPGCRFFDPRLASSITRRGHEVIERTRTLFESWGHEVLYGDTDSLFVHLDGALDEEASRAAGHGLAAAVDAFWRETIAREHGLESFLELRFDVLYSRFLLPTMRGSERGSKKRYAGAVRTAEGGLDLVVRGLEAVRTDWTPLARQTQRELLRRVFSDEPWEAWLRGVHEDLLAGDLDGLLVYRKRLRRGLDSYGAAPPHVQAARMLGGDTRGEVEYVITTRGPEPLSKRSAPVDHAHYVDKQVAPAVDAVLSVLGTSFARVAGAQMRLF